MALHQLRASQAPGPTGSELAALGAHRRKLPTKGLTKGPGKQARPLRLCRGPPQRVGPSLCSQAPDLPVGWGGGGRAGSVHKAHPLLGNGSHGPAEVLGTAVLTMAPGGSWRHSLAAALSPQTSDPVQRNVTGCTSSSRVPFPRPSSVSPAAPSAPSSAHSQQSRWACPSVSIPSSKRQTYGVVCFRCQ